jgi:hypothetical protein
VSDFRDEFIWLRKGKYGSPVHEILNFLMTDRMVQGMVAILEKVLKLNKDTGVCLAYIIHSE